MPLDAEKKAELVERLKLARQKKLEIKKQKEITEVIQPLVEKPVEVQEDTLEKVEKVEKPAVEKQNPISQPAVEKQNPTSPKIGKTKNQKDKFMKIVFYKEPKQKTLNKIQSVLDDDSDQEEDEIKLPPKMKKPVKTPRVKEESKPAEPKIDERQAYLKQLASMYY